MIWRRGFSLLETLIATGVLIVVVLGVVALSNSLVAGTIVNADKTIVNRWAVEGLELAQKVRDDNVLAKNTDTVTGVPVWFKPAFDENGNGYGWYRLNLLNTGNKWELIKLPGATTVNYQSFSESGERLSSDQTLAFRLICIEAFSAIADNTEDAYGCNLSEIGGSSVNDGTRFNPSTNQCNQNDGYCSLTQESLNERGSNQQSWNKLIAVGNSVKVRSVIVWQDREQYRHSSVSTLLTNWRSYEQ